MTRVPTSQPLHSFSQSVPHPRRATLLAQMPTHFASLLPPSRTIGPDTCNRGKVELFEKNGGSFPMPACGSWQGVINYPTPMAPFHAMIRVSTTKNYGVPPPPSGTAIFYIEMVNRAVHSAPAFGGPTNVQDTITSQAFDPSHTYTLIVYNLFYNSQCGSDPSCPPWIEDLGSPSPSGHSLTFDSPFWDSAWSTYPMVWQFVED